MKTIGMIGGMSWESSIEYYRIINETVQRRLGGVHSAKSVMVSVDFAEVEELQRTAQWDDASLLMTAAARQVEKGGGDFIVICTNTMHKFAEDIEECTNLPLLHIADATAQRILAEDFQKVGLLGTNFTMEEDFYKGRLNRKYGLEVLIPEKDDRQTVHRIIYDELVKGQIKPESKQAYLEVIGRLAVRGAQGIILGCTEIGLLVKEGDTAVPLFDTTQIHAAAAVDFALREP